MISGWGQVASSDHTFWYNRQHQLSWSANSTLEYGHDGLEFYRQGDFRMFLHAAQLAHTDFVRVLDTLDADRRRTV